MKQYLELVKEVLRDGIESTDRTGVGTLSKFGVTKEYDLSKGFPIITTKKIKFVNIVNELLWFLSGSTNINDLPEETQIIWKDWADKDGSIGKGYGRQWTNWETIKEITFEEFIEKYNEDMTTYLEKNTKPYEKVTYLGIDLKKRLFRFKHSINQIKKIEWQIQKQPDSRRIILSAWNVGEVEEAALPPCHSFIQFYVRDNKISLHLYQRSGDIALGIPYNITSYSLLLLMFAKTFNLEADKFIHTIGDAHIYLNHVDKIKKQVLRETKELPILTFDKRDSVLDYKAEDFSLNNYNHDSFIKYEVAV